MSHLEAILTDAYKAWGGAVFVKRGRKHFYLGIEMRPEDARKYLAAGIKVIPYSKATKAQKQAML